VTKWTVRDRLGNEIYLTEERWRHILESRPEMEPFLDEFLETIRTGRRKQDSLLPDKFFYHKRFEVLFPRTTIWSPLYCSGFERRPMGPHNLTTLSSADG
jgi:hypothetical protein